MLRMPILIFVLSLLLFGCGEQAPEPIDLDLDEELEQEEELPNEPRDYTGPIGGDRPVTAVFPENYDVYGNHPLLIQLHGVGSNAFQTEGFFDTRGQASDRGVVILTPEGTINSSGDRFWNATDVCCDWSDSGVDDVGYLTGLIEEAVEKYAVDPDRIFFLGLSNGGFMSHRMACDRGDMIRGIVSFNGSSFMDPDDCAAEHPVQILHIHATEDDIVPYDGHFALPSAPEVVDRWVDWNDCDPEPVDGPDRSITTTVAGEETTTEIWTDCLDGGDVQFWTMHGAEHVPYPLDDFAAQLFDVILDEH